MKKLFYLLPVLIGLSCSTDEGECIEIPMQDPEVMDYGGELKPITFNDKVLHVQEIDGTYVYQGDIMIPADNEKSNSKAVGMTSSSNLWKDNIVYYDINPYLPNQKRVTDAMTHWENKTSVRFVKRTTQAAYVYFTTGSGCSSYVGKIGTKQNVTLADACSTGNTIHEIGHAVGLFHEQSRDDRDKDVKVLMENVQAGREHNFDKVDPYKSYKPRSLTADLDFGSIMMYGSYSFSSNGKPTITKINGNTFSIQRNGLSAGDIAAINSIYPKPDIDSDGDGVLDSKDRCPNTVGPVENDGCPWADTDGDGVLDKDDNCPNVAGPVANKGCPWPDTDGDGIPDKDDRCPTVAGVDYNYGCPPEPSPTTWETCGEIPE